MRSHKNGLHPNAPPVPIRQYRSAGTVPDSQRVEMSRQDDARVAEILGVRPTRLVPVLWNGDGTPYEYDTNLPFYTTDPAADYKVLEWAREKWGYWKEVVGGRVHDDLFYEYKTALEKVIGVEREWEHCNCNHMNYQPGDYSRALLALKDKGLV